MKKNVIVLLILLFIFPLISSLEINMGTEFSQGETVIASFPGDLLSPITKNNFEFYRGHVRTSFDYDVAKIGENYYFYFQLGSKLPNNYSVVIKNAKYLEQGQVITENIVQDFIITSDKADFSTNPGFIVSEKPFSIKIQNLKSSQITINLDSKVISGETSGSFDFFFNNEDIDNSLTLFSGAIDYVDVFLENIPGPTLRIVTLNTQNSLYEVPVYILPTSQPEEINETINETVPEINETINQTTSEINETQEEINETTEETIPETNEIPPEECTWIKELFGLCERQTSETQEEINETINETVPEINETINQTTSEINETINETVPEINETINQTTSEINETINETVPEINETINQTTSEINETLEGNETEKEYEIIEEKDGSLIVIEDGKIVEVEATLKTCADLKGDICEEGELCNTQTVYAKDNKCCITACVKEEANPVSQFIAAGIILLVILILLAFRSKFRKTKNKKDILLKRK